MTQSYYQPIAYNLDGKEDLLYWKITACSSGYELYLKAIVTTPTTAKSSAPSLQQGLCPLCNLYFNVHRVLFEFYPKETIN
jgi:hypothetical protein